MGLFLLCYTIIVKGSILTVLDNHGKRKWFVIYHIRQSWLKRLILYYVRPTCLKLDHYGKGTYSLLCYSIIVKGYMLYYMLDNDGKGTYSLLC